MVSALNNPNASRTIFDIGGPENFTYHEAISLVAKVMGKEPKITYTPFWLAKALAHIINQINQAVSFSRIGLKFLLWTV